MNMDTEFAELETMLAHMRDRFDNVVEAKMKEVEDHTERTCNSDGKSREGWRTLYERFFGR